MKRGRENIGKIIPGEHLSWITHSSGAFSSLKYAKAIRDLIFWIIISEQGEAFDIFFHVFFLHTFIQKAGEATGLINFCFSRSQNNYLMMFTSLF